MDDAATFVGWGGVMAKEEVIGDRRQLNLPQTALTVLLAFGAS